MEFVYPLLLLRTLARFGHTREIGVPGRAQHHTPDFSTLIERRRDEVDRLATRERAVPARLALVRAERKHGLGAFDLDLRTHDLLAVEQRLHRKTAVGRREAPHRRQHAPFEIEREAAFDAHVGRKLLRAAARAPMRPYARATA